MPYPRVRFTVRRMMVAVAILAVALVVAIPVLNRLLWLYNAPLSINLVGGDVTPEWIILRKPAPVGRPVAARCSYRTSVSSSIPSGLPYRLSAEVKLIDPAGTVVESHTRTRWVFARGGPYKEDWAELDCSLTPRRPGGYMIRYEVNAADLFGRSGRVALHTGGFTAQ